MGKVTFSMILDGLSNTLFVGEKQIPAGQLGIGWWDCSLYNGDYSPCSGRGAGPAYALALHPEEKSWGFGSAHPGICQFSFGDGSVRSLPVTINPTVLGLLANRHDGQVIPDY